MANLFPVIEIQPEWVLEPEALGSKQKFWYRQPESKSDWLFKYPKQNTGQHWAEKIAAEIASCMDIPHARVELALFQGEQGSIAESFVQVSQDLFHGNQILARKVSEYDPKIKRKQSDHTLENIFLVLGRTFTEPEGVREAKILFSDYLVLDATIGNTDRHHENWGILLQRMENNLWDGVLAPSFDHASSLGQELLDTGEKQCRQKILNAKQLGSYSEKASGAIYWNNTDRKGISPLELVRRAAVNYPEIFNTAIRRVERLDRSKLEEIVSRVPEYWMTPLARRFSIELMCYNLEQLRRIYDRL
jgi:hypothetical protein